MKGGEGPARKVKEGPRNKKCGLDKLREIVIQ